MPLSLREKLKQASRANLANNAAKTMHKLAVMERPDAGSTAVAVEANKPTNSPTQSPTDQPNRLPSNLPNYREAHTEAYPPTQAPTVPPTVRETYLLTHPKDYPVANPDLNDDVWAMLTPAQRQVLAYLAGHGGEITRYTAISAETGLSVGTIQTIFKRLKKLGLMTSQYSSRGTIKGMRFSLDRRVFERTDPVDYQKAHPIDYPLNKPPSRLPTQSPTQTSGNVLIDREKNLSISLAILQTTWPTLAKTGFGLEQLRQIVENLTALAKPTDRILQGLDHIEFELTHGELVDKEGQLVADPCSWTFRSLAQNGYYRRPKGYVSPEEQALLDQEEESRAVLEAQKKAEQARFEAWQASLTSQELDDMLRDHPGGPKDVWLRHIWKERGEK